VFARLHHVQLSMPRGQEDRARSFYAGLLGFTEVAKPSLLADRGGVWFRADGGLELHLGVEDPFAPAGRAHPGIEVADVGEVANRLEAAGHPVVWDGSLPGYRRCYAADAFGNRLEFLTPDAPASADG
jgi:catechol 2,3-dioxygenase-like lactoylglutathione lyase family enzyme